jgi:hypothetical protein
MIGVASFARPVSEALARRFGWIRRGMLVASGPPDGEPLWSAASEAAIKHGLPPEGGAFVTDDGWETESATARGCVLALKVDASRFSEALARLDGFGRGSDRSAEVSLS